MPRSEPSERVTLTLKTFNRSNEIWLLASGEPEGRCGGAGRGASRPAITGRAGAWRLDATYWFLDRGAASKLPYYHCRF
jgi:6-phosphogluconolactonase